MKHTQTRAIKEAQKAGTKYQPQLITSLNLTKGRSNLNVLAILRAYHKLASDIAEGIASNKTAQHQGRNYHILEAIAMKHGLERERNPWSYLKRIKPGKRSKKNKQTKKVKTKTKKPEREKQRKERMKEC